MCGSVQRQSILSWHQAGEETERWPRKDKVAAVAGTFFGVVAVAGVIWGGYDIFVAPVNQDSWLFTKGVIILGSSLASAAVSTLAWTCLCISRTPEDEQEEERIV